MNMWEILHIHSVIFNKEDLFEDGVKHSAYKLSNFHSGKALHMQFH